MKNHLQFRQLLLLVPIIGNLLYMHYRVLNTCAVDIETGILARGVTSVLFDTFFLTLILLPFCKIKYHISCAITFVATLVWSIINTCYATYFESYLSFSMLGETGSLRSLALGEYITESIKASDAYYIISILFFVATYKWLGKKKQSTTHTLILLGVPTICITAFFLSLKLFIYEGAFTLPNANTISQLTLLPTRERIKFNPTITVAEVGVVRGQVMYSMFGNNTSSSLTPERRKEIDAFITKKTKHFQRRNNLQTRRYDRIIFIIAESYISATANLSIGGKTITPYLDSLRQQDDVCVNDSMLSNVEMGISSDGQFIYMTGLLPLKNKLTISEIDGKTLPALPLLLKQMGYQTMMTIPTEKSMWSQSEACSQYGIERLYSNRDFNKNEWLNDQELFQFATANERSISADKGAKQFFHLMLTISTHSPYTEAKEDIKGCECMPTDFPSSYSCEYKNYLMACHYMDHNIQHYIHHLKQTGAYDNSLIIIASDHGWREDKRLLPKGVNKDMLSFFILNAPEGASYHKGRMNQLDVFPSVVDLVIPKDKLQWQGLGSSIFDAEHFTGTISTTTRAVSADIIDFDYFSK